MWSCVWLLCGSGDLNSSLHVFTANALPSAISAVQAGLRLTSIWPLPPEDRNSKHVLHYLAILSSVGHCVRVVHCCQMLVPGNTVTQQSKIQLEFSNQVRSERFKYSRPHHEIEVSPSSWQSVRHLQAGVEKYFLLMWWRSRKKMSLYWWNDLT